MEWQDHGLILGVRRHGETSAIVELMTRAHGRHLGLVRGGRSSRLRPVLQPGNCVKAVWRARLDEHLGVYQLEPDCLRAARLMESPVGIYGIQTLASHLRLLPERDPHTNLYQAALVILEHLEDVELAAPLMVRFELALLEELGFGLDLERCAASGAREDLVYVSPKSGKAVSRIAGAQWADRLLALPRFLTSPTPVSGPVHNRADGMHSSETRPFDSDIVDGMKLAEFFLMRHVYGPRNIAPPDEREGFRRQVMRAIERLRAAG